MTDRDENEQAVRYVEKAIDSDPVNGEDLISSPDLKPDGQRQAIDYAKTRQGFSQGEIHMLNNAGEMLNRFSSTTQGRLL